VHEVRDFGEREAQRADRDRIGRVVLAQLEGVLDEVLVAPCADDAAERVARVARRVQLRARGRVGARSTATGCWRGA
jgi:hypothetical protein